MILRLSHISTDFGYVNGNDIKYVFIYLKSIECKIMREGLCRKFTRLYKNFQASFFKGINHEIYSSLKIIFKLFQITLHNTASFHNAN